MDMMNYYWFQSNYEEETKQIGKKIESYCYNEHRKRKKVLKKIKEQ